MIKEEAKQILGQGPARPLGAVRNLYTKIGTSIKAMGQPPLSSLSPSPSPFYQPDSQGQCLCTGEFYPLKQASGFLEKQQFSNMICLYTLASSGQTVPPQPLVQGSTRPQVQLLAFPLALGLHADWIVCEEAGKISLFTPSEISFLLRLPGSPLPPNTDA